MGKDPAIRNSGLDAVCGSTEDDQRSKALHVFRNDATEMVALHVMNM
jgi:hypothetical protein